MDQVFPVGGGMDIHFDDAGIGGDDQAFQPVVAGWFIAFDADGHVEFFGGGFDGRDGVEVMLEVIHRRKEDIEDAVADFGAEGGFDDFDFSRIRDSAACCGGVAAFDAHNGY
jgi:hypothetical protein